MQTQFTLNSPGTEVAFGVQDERTGVEGTMNQFAIFFAGCFLPHLYKLTCFTHKISDRVTRSRKISISIY